jgi:predicted CoA-binding protein
VVEEIIEWTEQTDQKPVIWTQYSVSSEEAEKLAEEHGFRYVNNECLKVEHQRWIRKLDN